MILFLSDKAKNVLKVSPSELLTPVSTLVSEVGHSRM